MLRARGQNAEGRSSVTVGRARQVLDPRQRREARLGPARFSRRHVRDRAKVQDAFDSRAAAASRDVIDLRARATLRPRRWNLWDLERLARDEAQTDPLRYEEWSYLFVNLRQFATPDRSLPAEFDDLVRESFGELLDHARRLTPGSRAGWPLSPPSP